MLEINNVSYYLENEEGIDHVQIRFEKGGIYSIIGPAHNGQLALTHVISNIAHEKNGLLYLNKMPVEIMDRKKYAQKVNVMRNVYNYEDDLTIIENLRNYSLLMRSPLSLDDLYQKLLTIGISEKRAHCKVANLEAYEIFRLNLLKPFLLSPTVICLYSSSRELTMYESEGMLLELIDGLDLKEHVIIFISNDEYVLPGTTELWGINKGNVLFIK